ncbi:hypothetical protein LWI29_022170 [Acer saccharum]|uniref:Uncharacterized protein n=1 Tax=Acer saccharum TaxID=4024 RepID=A0AA39VR34_ACESA|nr:hypothetical protein LWI29_022170 [Acer saccharum]
MTSRREKFTIWMRSLICHTNGCTVYDSNGDIVYRVDNYDQKCRDKVYLMDLRGQVLFTIRTKEVDERLLLVGNFHQHRVIDQARSIFLLDQPAAADDDDDHGYCLSCDDDHEY